MNSWIKLTAVALSGIVISFGVLWGIKQFDQSKYYNGYNNQQQYQGGMNSQGMNTQGMNTQGMNTQGMNTQGMNAQGMNAQGMNSQSGMGMDKMMGQMMGMMGGM